MGHIDYGLWVAMATMCSGGGEWEEGRRIDIHLGARVCKHCTMEHVCVCVCASYLTNDAEL